VTTVLLTTHYMEEAARLCDRVAIVDRGRRLALGTPSELVASLGAEHVIELEASGELAEPSSPRLPASRRCGGARPPGGSRCATWRARCRAARPARGARLEPTRLATHHATLEDLFLALAGRGLEEST